MSYFNETRVFSADFRKILKTSNFMKIRREEAELFNAGRTNGQWRINGRFS